MDYLLIYDKVYEERRALVTQLKDTTALLSDARLNLSECEIDKEVQTVLSEKEPLDLAVMEIAGGEDVALSREVREKKHQAEMMLVADASISPMEYMTPEIRACSLLLRPYQTGRMKTVVRSFLENYFHRKESGDVENCLIIENREGRIAIPYNDIYYIEVQGKKLFVRLRDREYTLNDSLENIRKILPEYFKQSHRSFVFNSQYLERVRLSENTIYLRDEIAIPLSRSFKSQIKELLNVD
jgi:DNA-binding LytR/AlgR family response regulator